MSLPAALAPLEAFPRFIAYRLKPNDRKPGKQDKLPVDWRSGTVADAHDLAIQTDYWGAYSAVLGGLADGVGFVLGGACPAWCLDLDDCLDDATGNWSATALALISAFPGAAVEVSISGRGLHIWGWGALPEGHPIRGRYGDLALELYSRNRFIALSPRPDSTVGDIRAAEPRMIAGLLAIYFPQGTPAAPAAAWTDRPHPEWDGPTDDAELLRIALSSKSAGSAFGTRASFSDLWHAFEPTLSKVWPDSGRAYDASKADAALAQHLAFYTGKDCERIERLMRQSALAREKWDEHKTYLQITILAALGKQVDVFRYRAKAVEPVKTLAASEAIAGNTWLSPEEQMVHFKGCTYVADVNQVLTSKGEFYGKEKFDAMFGNRVFVIDNQNGKTTRSAWDAFTNSLAVVHPKVETSEFMPSLAPNAIWQEGNRSRVNTWRATLPTCGGETCLEPVCLGQACPKSVNALAGVAPFLRHLQLLLPAPIDRESLISYMAALVQYPGVKFQWCPLIQGTRGNGKTFLNECIVKAIGRDLCHSPKASELTGKFNGWLDRKLFIAVEDIYVPGDQAHIVEILKPMITRDWQEIERKGQDQVSRRVFANFILNTNRKDAIPHTEDNRGLAVYYTAQQSVADMVRDGMMGAYFPDLYNWANKGGYSAINRFLRTYKIPEALNPAGACHRAPITTSNPEALAISLDATVQEIQYAVEMELPGFRGNWISSHFLDLLLENLGVLRKYARNKRASLIELLGYVPHPGLARNKGQAYKVIQPDGVKAKLYVRLGSPESLLEGMDVERAYTKAQAAPLTNLVAVPPVPSAAAR